MKMGSVVAVLPYPSLPMEDSFPATAAMMLSKIDALAKSYPMVSAELGKVLGRWSRALSGFQQTKQPGANIAEKNPPNLLRVRERVLEKANISRATDEMVTITHTAGVLTVPIAELTGQQIISLNRSSANVQLPLGITSSTPAPQSAVAGVEESSLTLRMGKFADSGLKSISGKLGVKARTINSWFLVVVFPALILALLVGLIFALRSNAR